MKAGWLGAIAALAIALAAPAHADVDADFAARLHTYGVYGPKDYNAWLGKIVCKRLGIGQDADAYKSADFILRNLPPHSTVAQSWQFLATSIDFYCPELRPVLERAAAAPT
ncbi:DUF732 domain-containing protein [Mycobacterium sp.]|jgi:hypothetical protein|uniref:DUF732 domain-containing protein n=1 Tax=Mycobacterium sp. TaxID=1785 RepID=UPI002D29160C|nr:DUF732 domain-containing protein [Mycobacterium sp.]HZA08463.1 DUF732 domain-containing protein [Mycobacterium sp.]